MQLAEFTNLFDCSCWHFLNSGTLESSILFMSSKNVRDGIPGHWISSHNGRLKQQVAELQEPRALPLILTAHSSSLRNQPKDMYHGTIGSGLIEIQSQLDQKYGSL